MEFTFFIIKPDAVAAGHVEEIVKCLKEWNFEIVAQEQRKLTRNDVIFLCPMHVGRDFFEDLVAFLMSGPSELFVLRRDSATSMLNKLVGETDPNENHDSSLRRKFGKDVRRNAVHSPNSGESAVRELLYFFSDRGLY